MAGTRVGLAEPTVPGLSSSQLEPELKGLALIEELNCAACHAGDPALAARSKKAPRLAEVGSRVNPSYLEAFIGDPHWTKPGTTMPDLLGQKSREEKRMGAKAITHFLLSTKPGDFAPQPPDAVAARLGERLFHSRGCAACHSPRDAKGKELLTNSSTPLGDLEKKYSFKSLVEFLRQPHASRPSGRMPDLRLAGQDIERIAHYLLRETRVPGALGYTLYGGQVWEGLESEEVKPERAGQVKDFALASLGGVHHHTAIQYEGWINIATSGPHKFFLKMNGGSLQVDGKRLVQQKPSDQRGVLELEGAADLAAGWRKIELTYFHTGHDPKFSFEMAGPDFPRQAIPSSMLSVSKEPIPAFAAPQVDAVLAGHGRDLFAKFGCANCHDDLGVRSNPGPAFAKLTAGRGCLSDTSGPWPQFGLSAEQRGWIAKALPTAERPQLSDKQRIDKTLATLNCVACHERAGLGGIAPERNALFTGTEGAMGDQGRLPPPLTHVGAKLKPEWMREVLLGGQRQRRYLNASMPQFGEGNVGQLTELFGKVDALETAPIPKVADVQASKKAGHEMVGSEGLACIACHDFNGQKSEGVGALDIARAPERLKKNWFHLYMRAPSRFHPTVIMPTYWPDGQSTRPGVLGGDTAQQIEALWVYLEDGVRAKKPTGLSRQSNEIHVGDMAEICRGQSPVGYRGIGVGYPERLNLAFDAGEMALRQLWKGEFANVDAGSFHPRGSDSLSFPPGIPFHRLASMEDIWPRKGKTNYPFPQDHGYEFRGYHLDKLRRPTFLYNYGEIAVEDYFEDARDKEGKAYFKRTIRFATTAEPSPFYFRAAVGKKITARSGREFEVDRLRLRIADEHEGTVREGNAGEVLIRLAPPKGSSTIKLEYQW